MSDSLEFDRRVVDLEIRYTHQQRVIEELHAVVLEQGRDLARLGQELGRLRQRLLSVGAEGDRVEDCPPPHY